MPTPNLNIATEIDSLDLALTDTVDQDLTSGDVTVTDADFRENIILRAINNTVARNLTVPALKRLFVVRNDGTATLTVLRGTTSVTVGSTQAGLFYTDGTSNGLKEIAGSGGASAPAAFAGVWVTREADISVNNATVYRTQFDTLKFQNTYNGYKLWLGPDLAFTGLSMGNETVTATAHAMVTGDGPLYLQEDNTLPVGLFETTKYWVIRVDDNTIKFAASFSDALADSPVNLTTLGTSTNTLIRADKVVIPNGITRVRVTIHNRWDGDNDGARDLWLYHNTSIITAARLVIVPVAAFNNPLASTGTPVINVVGGDYLQTGQWQNANNALNLTESGLNMEIIE